MSKRAEEAALKAYPKSDFDGVETRRKGNRKCFIKGYEQAKKDLALTWEDAKKINDLFMEVTTYFSMVGRNKDILEQPFYEEVIKRFNEQRKK